MSKVKFIVGLLTLAPLGLSAQGRDAVISSDEVAYASIFAGDFSLLLAVVIGVIATFFVFRAAKKMGVQASLVQDHFDSLLKMGLIKVVNKELLPTFATVWSKNGISSHAIRKFHKQMLEKASNAIELQNIEDRSLHAAQIPIRKEDYAQIEKDIVKFRNGLMRKYGRVESKDADSVYGVNIQLFRLTE